MSTVRKTRRIDVNPDATRDIFLLIEEVIPDPEQWIDAPNAHFDGKTPRQAIESGEELFVRNLVLAVKYGMFS
jgi:hypothetical protein